MPTQRGQSRLAFRGYCSWACSADAAGKENLAFLRLIYTRLGLSKFPGQLPNTIIQEVAEEGEEPAEPPQVPIPDLVSLLNWTFERDDERWGQWVVQINTPDSF